MIKLTSSYVYQKEKNNNEKHDAEVIHRTESSLNQFRVPSRCLLRLLGNLLIFSKLIDEGVVETGGKAPLEKSEWAQEVCVELKIFRNIEADKPMWRLHLGVTWKWAKAVLFAF